MRILITADPFIPVPPKGYGGIERIVDSLATSYKKKGHTVGLVAHADSTCSVDRLFKWKGTGTLRNSISLSQFSRQFKPDILHSFSRLGYLISLLAKSLPKVMSYQRHTGGRQIALASMLGGKSLTFTGCSEFIAAMGRSSGGIWKAIPNFVDTTKFDFVSTVPCDAPLVFLSRIESIKGPDLAISIARASGRSLVLAGNKPNSAAELEFWNTRIAPELGKDGVEWVGEVDDVKKNALLGRAAALIVPIQWDEPFGIVFAEALATGTPVITCSRGAAPEIIEPNRTGFFISDVESGAIAVRRLAEIDRRDCRREVEARFSSEVCADVYLNLYRQCIERTH